MDKPTKKNKKYTYDQGIIRALAEKYRVTPFYVRQCLSGFSTSGTADNIKLDYKELDKKIKATYVIFINNL
ncbi:hypothetical protein BC749_1011392 [Flavobacterium araucananum]|jgi:hypothetical protein|uniref:Uncharacterized protein n=1 Tax=Flavobacterium araucananum TaxID=946678 RepID=A0A227NV73_9FLAO|nr:hypothetical protein [Flavobacterium araucananum]OXG00806.1 hypothetical protein B0A64_19470 [Flavobacterium araucananum]PWK03293.1 hypothetical protein BC749_1011392 [Flavobacterium araucananum]